MKIEISETNSRQTNDITSASALEICNESMFIAGDDSSEVVELDFDYNLLNRIQLFDSPVQPHERIPKKLKQDLEASLLINLGLTEGILFLGSGSNQNRECGYFVPTVNTTDQKSYPIQLSSLYDYLRSLPEFSGIPKLNIEAAVSTTKDVILMHRRTGLGENLVVFIDRKEFENYLSDPSLTPSSIRIAALQMPSIDGVVAGISGATLLPDIPIILASASFEATNDAIDDGDILGSALFLLPADPQLLDLTSPIKPNGFTVLTKDNIRLISKVESVAIKSGNLQEGYKAVAVSDDDKGGSEILELLLNVTVSEG